MPEPEEDSELEVEVESDSGENGAPSNKQKYRELKRKLKYLVYEHECFQSDLQKAQTKLLQLSRDKSFLLDQLMRYEAVIVSDDSETDYSSTEEEGGASLLALGTPPSQAQKMESTLKGAQMSTKTVQASKAAGTVTIVPSQMAVKQGATKTATSQLGKTTGAASKAGNKKQTKPGGGGGTKVSANAVAKITKTVARARQPPVALPLQHSSPLVVSLPLSLTNYAQRAKKLEQQQQLLQQQPPPLQQAIVVNVQQQLQQHQVNALHSLPPQPISQVQQIQVPPMQAQQPAMQQLPAASSSSSSSSTSSSSSDSDDSGSESSSSSEEEPMETGGPVTMVTSISGTTSSTQLVRPKAVISPVKAPPQLIQTASSSSSPPPLVHTPTPPGSHIVGFSWSNRQMDSSSSSSGFVSIAPPLSSPPASLPFSPLGKPSSGSAFQIVSPKLLPSLQDSSQ